MNVTFSNNTAEMGGAIFNDGRYSGASSPSLMNITFSDNIAATSGGALINMGYDGTCNPSLTNVTFSGNSAGRGIGGAIYNDNSNPTLTNVTFSGNVSFYNNGQAFYNVLSNPILTNVILWDDGITNSAEFYNYLSTPIISSSVVRGGFLGGTNIITTNPLLSALADNGGFTRTIALEVGSPAINAGSIAGCPATDQRGVARPQGAACDIGAYEVDTTPPGVTSFTLKTPAASPTNADTLVFLATFGEAMTGVDAADFAVNSSPATSATVTGVTPVTPSTYDVTISGGDLAGYNGTINLNLSGTPTITDLAGNALPAGEPPTDETYTVENTVPGVTSFTLKTPAVQSDQRGHAGFPGHI